MARKKKPEEHENLERWLVSYADFITLLFAFFVVMYSISSVNEGKYRVLSDAIVAAFRAPARSFDPIQMGKVSKSPTTEAMDLPFETRNKLKQMVSRSQKQRGQKEADKALGSIRQQIIFAMSPLMDQGLINVRETPFWLEVEIKSNVLFPSGSSVLTKNAEQVLAKIADIIKKYPNSIHVEGYTDNRPIENIIYPSNWELSTARSSSVVRLFGGKGVAQNRMVAIGFGEFRPIAGNDTAEGRQKNRRVVLVIMSGSQDDRHMTDIEQRGGSGEASPDTSGGLDLGDALTHGSIEASGAVSTEVQSQPSPAIQPIELVIEPAGDRQ